MTTASPDLDLAELIADTEGEIVRLVQDRDPSTHGLYEMVRYHLALDGKGGNGGKVSDVNVVATGIGEQWGFDFSRPDQIEGFPGFSLFLPTAFARYIGGEGGVSYGSSGGSGGNVENSTGTAVSTSMVVAAGKGGDGLTGGGSGGSVNKVVLNASATLGKVLAIAGDGGDVRLADGVKYRRAESRSFAGYNRHGEAGSPSSFIAEGVRVA